MQFHYIIGSGLKLQGPYALLMGFTLIGLPHKTKHVQPLQLRCVMSIRRFKIIYVFWMHTHFPMYLPECTNFMQDNGFFCVQKECISVDS